MKPIHEPKVIEGVVACPECGSEKTEKIENSNLMDKETNEIYSQYICQKCNTRFFPAMESKRPEIYSWAAKNAVKNNLNEIYSWKKPNKCYVLNENTHLPTDKICELFVLVTKKTPETQEYIDFVNGLRKIL